jgi:hypothetical protein
MRIVTFFLSLALFVFIGICLWALGIAAYSYINRLDYPTKCVYGYTLIRVGGNWIYQLKDNKQIPCQPS